MAKRKLQRWRKHSTADVDWMGKMAGTDLGKLGALVRRKGAERKLPEELSDLRAGIRYQDELHGYLPGKPDSEVTTERQLGRSRPDIVIGEIEIKIKGPTTNPGLATIADKIARYRLRFAGILCVLFDLQDETRYYELLRGIQDPGVVVVRVVT